jgi:two-component system chemotaxis response regulator CheB
MPDQPIRVLIVDDSRVFRTAVRDALSGDPEIQVVGSERNGAKAIEWLRANPADVITLDVEMPEMDGIATLKALSEAGIDAGVIMLSALTREGAELTIQALTLGAFDFITKPTTEGYDENVAALRQQLGTRIRACAARRRIGRGSSFLPPLRPGSTPPARPAVQPLPAVPARPVAAVPAPPPARPAAIPVRPGAAQAILVGVSTGGPKALMQMLPALCRRTRLPILIVQHMPPKFTASLAESLARACTHKVVEAQDGMAVEDGWAFIAPGGRHMVVRRNAGGKAEVGINDQPPECGLRPAADLLFRSAAPVFGANAVAVVLTGMGSDGTKGLAPLKRAGVPVIVQDEATSVVWGMPGSVVAAGLADQVLPLDQIPEAVARAAGR